MYFEDKPVIVVKKYCLNLQGDHPIEPLKGVIYKEPEGEWHPLIRWVEITTEVCERSHFAISIVEERFLKREVSQTPTGVSLPWGPLTCEVRLCTSRFYPKGGTEYMQILHALADGGFRGETEERTIKMVFDYLVYQDSKVYCELQYERPNMSFGDNPFRYVFPWWFEWKDEIKKAMEPKEVERYFEVDPDPGNKNRCGASDMQNPREPCR